MSIESKLDREIRESAEFRGEMRQFRSNMEKYIGAVSENQKGTAARLDAHIQDTDTAHGAAVREKSSKAWVSWLAFAISAVVGLLKVKDVLAH